MPETNRPKGRPFKEGLNYAGWSTAIFDNDGRIDKLLDAQGSDGFLIFFYLCQRAYGLNGYFYPWSYDDAATTARKIGGGVGSVTVQNTVNLCFRIGLFDKDLFDRHGILTGGDMQKVLRDVIVRRSSSRKIIKDYWILSSDESAGLNFCTLNPELQDHNANCCPDKSNYPPDKSHCLPQSKVNKTKGKESKGAAAPARENIDRPLSDRDRVLSGLSQYWQDLGGTSNLAVMDDLRFFLGQGIEPEAVREAMKESALNGAVRGWKYTQRILERYQREGIKTSAQAQAQGKERRSGGHIEHLEEDNPFRMFRDEI